MEATRLPFGVISAPGYRYHPAVLAQAAATLAEMYPDRLWWALGSGQAINEAITGEAWPEKAERNARLDECADIIRALFAGETVTHRGRVTVVEAKLYSRPHRPPPLLGGAVTEETAAFVGGWADGLITIQAEPARLRRIVEAFREAGGAGKPILLQVALSWAGSEEAAEAEALHQWAPNAIGGEVNWDLADVVAVVPPGRGLERHEPYSIDAETMQIVQAAAEALEIAHPVAVGVHERLDGETIDQRILVPEIIDHGAPPLARAKRTRLGLDRSIS